MEETVSVKYRFDKAKRFSTKIIASIKGISQEENSDVIILGLFLAMNALFKA